MAIMLWCNRVKTFPFDRSATRNPGDFRFQHLVSCLVRRGGEKTHPQQKLPSSPQFPPLLWVIRTQQSVARSTLKESFQMVEVVDRADHGRV